MSTEINAIDFEWGDEMSLQKIDVNPDMPIEELVKTIIHTSANQILLEVPEQAHLLNNEINLRLIKFYVEEEAKELLIHTDCPQIIKLAQKVGLATIAEKAEAPPPSNNPAVFTVARNVVEAASVPEKTPTPVRSNSNLRQGGLLITLPIAFFTLVIATWWFFQPKATVVVYPKEENLDFAVETQISPAITETSLESNKLPAKLVEKIAQLDIQNVATGSKVVGVTAAAGKVTFINASAQPIVVPKKTVVTGNNDTRFITDQDVLVPKKTTRFQNGLAVGEAYGRAETTITAEGKGTAFNLPAKSIAQVVGRNFRVLKVTNLTPTYGGEDKKVSVVTLEDVRKSEEEAKRQLELVGSGEINSLITKDYLFIPELIQTEIVRITSSPDIGMESTVITTKLEYRVSALVPAFNEVSKILNYRFEQNLPANFHIKNQKIELIAARVLSSDNQQALLHLNGRGKIQGALNAESIRKWLKGKNIIQAKEELARHNEIADYDIDVSGGGSKLPGFGFQIKVLLPSARK